MRILPPKQMEVMIFCIKREGMRVFHLQIMGMGINYPVYIPQAVIIITGAIKLAQLVEHWSRMRAFRCNRLRCPLARMSGLQCFNMGHNGHGINMYGVSMTLMDN